MERDDWRDALTVGPSPCAGQGLFARQPIPAGQRVLEYCGERITKVESAARRAAGNNYIFHLDFAHDLDGESLDNTARYVNHSCDPNCHLEKTEGRIFIVTSRELRPGEELSFDYGYSPGDYERFPCNCGARVCCGYMLAREFWHLIPQQWGEPTSEPR